MYFIYDYNYSKYLLYSSKINVTIDKTVCNFK